MTCNGSIGKKFWHVWRIGSGKINNEVRLPEFFWRGELPVVAEVAEEVLTARTARWLAQFGIANIWRGLQKDWFRSSLYQVKNLPLSTEAFMSEDTRKYGTGESFNISRFWPGVLIRTMSKSQVPEIRIEVRIQ